MEGHRTIGVVKNEEWKKHGQYPLPWDLTACVVWTNLSLTYDSYSDAAMPVWPGQKAQKSAKHGEHLTSAT